MNHTTNRTTRAASRATSATTRATNTKTKSPAKRARRATLADLQDRIHALETSPPKISTAAAQRGSTSRSHVPRPAVPPPAVPPSTPRRFDLGVRREGNLMMFHPRTSAMREWIEANVNVPGAVRFGNAFVVELRYVGPILEGLAAEGFTVGDEP